MTVYLTMGQLAEIASALLGEPGIRDAGLLASSAARPQMSAFGEDAYPTLPAKAAALMHSLARNHALIDGNKRLAWVATRAFLRLNGRDLRMHIDRAEWVVVTVAAGHLDATELAALLETHLVVI